MAFTRQTSRKLRAPNGLSPVGYMMKGCPRVPPPARKLIALCWPIEPTHDYHHQNRSEASEYGSRTVAGSSFSPWCEVAPTKGLSAGTV